MIWDGYMMSAIIRMFNQPDMASLLPGDFITISC